MWTYDGTFPGPTIRRPSGERTTVKFKHRLPKKAGELTVHLHGAHTRSKDDGQPGGLTRSQPRSFYCDISPGLSERASGNDLLIEPGSERKYRYDFTEDGADERAAMHWYHDHRLDRTGENVWRGLAGMWITEDAVDLALPLPRGDRDLPLMIADRDFDSKNQLKDPFDHLIPPDDGAQGKHVLVNGAVLPYHPVSAQRHRIRILNASNFRAYNLFFEGPSAATNGADRDRVGVHARGAATGQDPARPRRTRRGDRGLRRRPGRGRGPSKRPARRRRERARLEAIQRGDHAVPRRRRDVCPTTPPSPRTSTCRRCPRGLRRSRPRAPSIETGTSRADSPATLADQRQDVQPGQGRDRSRSSGQSSSGRSRTTPRSRT